MPEAQGGTGSHSGRIAGVVAFVVLFVVLLWFPWPYHERLLDDGWSLALGEFMRTRARAGVDYVFPYGPLGYLSVPALIPELFGLKYVWSILLAAVSAAALVRAAAHLPQLSARAGWLWLAVVFLPRTENRFIVVVVVIAVLHVLEEAWTTARVLLTTAFLAVVALVKFSFFVLALALVLFLCIAAPRRVRVLLGGSYLAALSAFWLVSGQSLFDFPRYLSRSFELMTGYSEAMSLPGEGPQVILACLVVALLIAGVAISKPQRRSWPALGMLISGAGLVWKECFVRQDAHHSVWFFGYAALASVLFHALPRDAAGTKRRLGLALMAGVPAIAVAVQASTEKDSIASFLVRAQTWSDARDAVGILLAPRRYVARSMPAVRKGATEWSLPEVAHRIGTEPMDVATVDQAVAIYNGFNFRPRPVFQSYSAYTPALAELNGEFIRGPRAPRFVLSRWTSIDRRFPPADDPLTLLGLLQRYRPVLRERDYVLLERHEGEAPPQDRGTVVLNARTQRGVRVALPTEDRALYTLAVLVRPTIAARFARLVYGAPRLPFEVELESGPRRSYELVSAVAAVPFVISPVLDEGGDLSSLYEARGARAVAVTIAKHGDGSFKHFTDDIEIRLVRYQWPPDQATARRR